MNRKQFPLVCFAIPVGNFLRFLDFVCQKTMFRNIEVQNEETISERKRASDDKNEYNLFCSKLDTEYFLKFFPQKPTYWHHKMAVKNLKAILNTY